jgi:hypothetical protein
LKPASGTARAEIVAPELFDKVFITVNYAVTPFDSSFGGISFAAFTASLERRLGR